MQVLYLFQFSLLLLQFFSSAHFVRPNHRRKKIMLKTPRRPLPKRVILPKIIEETTNKKPPTPPALLITTTKLTTKKSKHKKYLSETQEPIKIEVIHINHYPTQNYTTTTTTTTTKLDIMSPRKNAGINTHFKPSKLKLLSSFRGPFRDKVFSGGNKDLPNPNSITNTQVQDQEEGEEEEPIVMRKQAVRRPVPSFYLNGKPCRKSEISYCWDDGSCPWWQTCKTFNCITDCYMRFGDEWRWR